MTAAARGRRDDAPSPAVAPPPGNPRFALFDSLRAIAVLAVIAFHVGSITGALDAGLPGDVLALLGPQGLRLFFVISGFLLYRPFVAARVAARAVPDARRYARRRVLRIVPGYWVALTVLAIFPGVVGIFGEHWWRYYGFLQLYWQDTVTAGIPVAWTLCVEVTFYVLLPLWALGVRRLPGALLRTELATLAALAASGAAVQIAAARNIVPDLVASTFLGQSVWFALGMALATASVALEHRSSEPRWARAVAARPTVCWVIAAAAFLGLTLLLHPGGAAGIIQALNAQQPVAKTLAAIALGLCLNTFLVLPAIFGEDAGGLPRRVLAFAPLAWLGVVSYGVYLYHLTVAELLSLPRDPGHFGAGGLDLAARVDRPTTLVLFVLVTAVSAAIAAISYRFVELPFLRMKEIRPARAGGPRGG